MYHMPVINEELFFSALAHMTRRRIVVLLVGAGELCVCDIFSALEQPQAKVSRHLAVLRDSGVVTVRRQGTWIYYRLNTKLPQAFRQIVDGVLKVPDQRQRGALDRLRLITARKQLERCRQ